MEYQQACAEYDRPDQGDRYCCGDQAGDLASERATGASSEQYCPYANQKFGQVFHLKLGVRRHPMN